MPRPSRMPHPPRILHTVLFLLPLLLAACGDDPAPPAARGSHAPGDRQPAPMAHAAPPWQQPADAAPDAEDPYAAPPEPPEPREVVDWSTNGAMTGAWRGQWNFHGRGAEGKAAIQLKHYDESFNGTIQLSTEVGSLCGHESGTIVWGVQFDDYVTFGYYDIFSYGVTFHGTVSDGVLTGDFVAITECGAESGSFSMEL